MKLLLSFVVHVQRCAQECISALLHNRRNLSPVTGGVLHQTDTLKEVHGASGVTEEHIPAALHLRALKANRPSTVLQGALNQGAITVDRVVDGKDFSPERLVSDSEQRASEALDEVTSLIDHSPSK